MKKIFFLSLIGIFLLTGCDFGKTNTLSCNYENIANNLTTRINYDIDYEQDEIKKIRITYDYKNNTNKEQDGVGTGTDGTTNDTIIDDDGIIDGVVGETFDSIIKGVTDTILDVSGIKDRHTNIQNTYNGINGFSVQNITDVDDNYKVTYILDYDNISDEDLNRLNLSRNINTQRDNYTAQGFTCK